MVNSIILQDTSINVFRIGSLITGNSGVEGGFRLVVGNGGLNVCPIGTDTGAVEGNGSGFFSTEEAVSPSAMDTVPDRFLIPDTYSL